MSALLKGCFLGAKRIMNIRSPACLATDFTDIAYYGKEDVDFYAGVYKIKGQS